MNSDISSYSREKEIVRETIVAKIDQVNPVSDALSHVIQDVLGIAGVTAKVYVRYLVNGLSDTEYELARDTVLSEPPVDDILAREHIEAEAAEGKRVITIESLPGQYDARSDALQQCLMLQTGNKDHQVRVSSVVVLEGDIDDESAKKIENRLINPVEKEQVDFDDRELVRNYAAPEDVKVCEGFCHLTTEEMQQFLKEHKLAMNLDDINIVQAYFLSQRRDPTITEIKVLDTYRSDHCRHTTFMTKIHGVEIQTPEHSPIGKDIRASLTLFHKHRSQDNDETSLMELATSYTKHLKKNAHLNPSIHNLVDSEEINACSFTTEVEMADGTKEEREIQFKNETHNHPTEIEPFGGAATCLGGCIRDPMSGRSWVFQAMRISGSGDPTLPVSETLAGKLAQRTISQIAAQGYSSYGNQIGIHTGMVKNFFHPGYVAKHFECGFVIAGAPAQNIRRETPQQGDMVIMIGGRTGRDGIGGATGSSKTHDAKSVTTLGAEVQKGNPVEERKLTRLFLNPTFTKHVKRCNDFGAGGVSVAIGELARGLEIDLDKVLTKYAGLDGTELALSESQERMAVVIDAADYDDVMKLIDQENLEAVHIATVTDDPTDQDADMLTMKRKGKDIVNLHRSFLNKNGAERHLDKVTIDLPGASAFFHKIDSNVNTYLQERNIAEAFLANLSRLEVASQKGIGQIFDSSVGATNILAPYGGKTQSTPQIGMVSAIPSHNGIDSKTATISTYGFDADLSHSNSYLGAMHAVLESVTRSVALGGAPKNIFLTLQEYFGKLGDDSKRRGECYAALLGAYRAQHELSVPAIGGKDSMSGTFISKENERIDVPPTLVSFAVNTADRDRIISAEFKKPGNQAYCIHLMKDSNGLPLWDAVRAQLEDIYEGISDGRIISANFVERGGIAATVAKMSFGNNIGFIFDQELLETEKLFSEDGYGSIIVETAPRAYQSHDKIPGMLELGRTTNDETISFENEQASVMLTDARKAREAPLAEIFPTENTPSVTPSIHINEKSRTTTELNRSLSVNLLTSPPKAVVLSFPGTNSELDTRHQLIKAGLTPVEVLIRNSSEEALLASTAEMIKQLKSASLIVLPGGFSAGDEPDGSAKFITSVCRMKSVQDALNEFLSRDDTLTLGICNGFQALIKLGVFDNGLIEDKLHTNSPTLTYNHNHRHIIDQVGLQVTSVLSPFMETVKLGDTFVIPVSHGEGRLFMRDRSLLQKYINNGQVALQYLDQEGNPTSEYNGSLQGVAALCSPDGRILGLMPHPERTSPNLFKNIPGNHDLPLFQGAANALGVGAYKK